MVGQPASSEPLQVIGVGDDPFPPPRRMRGGVVVVVLAIAVFLVGMFPNDDRDAPIAVRTPQPLATPTGESLLRHPRGGPVDVVERFMVAISYRQPEVAVQALTPNATAVRLPFLSTTPERLAAALAIYGDTRAAIALHGCAIAGEGTPVEVRCPITFHSKFVRDIEAKGLRGVLSFVVEDGLISSMSVVELESPIDEVDATFERWLVDFYFERA